MPRKIIIDTDPGIDDALAIFIALASPEFDIAGITTVAGNIGIATTTRNAGRILALGGRDDIPVHAGAARPLVADGLRTLDIHGNDGLGGVAFPEPRAPAGTDAVNWMAALLRSEPEGAIDILALGPLTNLARLALDHSDALSRIGRIIAMGGAIHEPGNMGLRAEFNIAADPHAANVVTRADVALVMIPLDVTRRVRATRETIARLTDCGTPVAIVCAELIDAYFQSTRGRSNVAECRPLHDPCVMAYALEPSLFELKRLPLAVELGTGALEIDGDNGTAIDVALGIDGAKALEFMIEHMMQ